MQMLDRLLAPVTVVAPCKVCGESADLYGVADFNKSCEEQNGKYLRLSGVPVYYHRCNACGFIFSNAFDQWTSVDFKQHLYNDDYVLVDPDYISKRPQGNARFIAEFIKNANALKCLDYGGGNGETARLLKGRRFDASSWDPFGGEGDLPLKGSFDFVSAFEVFEHTVDPAHTAAESLGMLNDNGVLVFSTLTTDHIPARSMDHWYIAPRNGHISLYTKRALAHLFAQYGYRVHHFSNGTHMAIRNTPSWLQKK